jgi:6-pyruvoyl-tetrahydropterin synthase
MYSVSVRDHVMIAHSLKGETFGPAQGLHGATFVVDVELHRRTLDADGVVADMGLLATMLRDTLAVLNYRNLDDEDQFAGQNTTTEVLAHWVFERLAARLRQGDLGAAARDICELRVTLRESHVAWASFRGDPRAPA